MANIIASAIKGAISFAGELSLRDTIALIERMDLFIVGDTGPMHIADALRTPMITLFCPSEPKITGPYHAEKAIIVKKPCRVIRVN
ncbi:MAG: glycosyltransferase family 9 protein [Nitrospirota bacterium]